MNGLLLVAHGSRHQPANDEVAALVDKLEDSSGRVAHCFLEMAAPDMVATIIELYGQGVRQLTILPLFLAGGAHVKRDIPARVAEALERCEGLEVEILPHLMALPQWQGFINQVVENKNII